MPKLWSYSSKYTLDIYFLSNVLEIRQPDKNLKVTITVYMLQAIINCQILQSIQYLRFVSDHGSHRSWHTFFKDFARTFEVHFQGVFKNFSLFFQTSICEKMINNTFRKRHTETIWSWVRQRIVGEGWDLGTMYFLFFLDDLLTYDYNTASYNIAWKGDLGVLPQNNFLRISTKSCNSRQFWRVH